MTPPSDAALAEIAHAYGVALRFAPAGTMRDLSSSDRRASPPWITLGTYASQEARAADFFHELGHCVNGGDHPAATMGDELRAWITGFGLAARHDVHFSSTEVRRAFAQLSTYLGADDAERRLWNDARFW